MNAAEPLAPRVGVAALSSPLEVGAARAPQALTDLARFLAAGGCEVVPLGAVADPEQATTAGRRAAAEHLDALAFVAASWFEDYLVLDLLEECAAPILLWALPGMETGALCGTQQLTAFLRQLGAPFACVFGSAEDAAGQVRAAAFLRGAALRSRLRRARIGMAGHRVNGMTHTAPNEFALKQALGPRVVWLDLPQLLEQAAAAPVDEAQRLWRATAARAGACEVAEEDGITAMRLYLALRAAVAQHGLQALTVGCYPHLMGRVCLAASRLAEEGIPLACEGDVHGAVGQYLLQRLTGQPTHNTDWLDPVDDHSVVFTHCGSGAFGLAARPAEIRLASVRLMGQGACALFTAKPGLVTLVNLTPDGDGYCLGLLEAEAVPTTMVFPGNPVQVRFARPVAELLEWVHATGLGHHWMIGYGHVGTAIRAWVQIAGAPLRLAAP